MAAEGRNHLMTQASLFGEEAGLSGALRDLIADYGYEFVLTELRRLAPTHAAASAPARHGDPETSHLASKQEVDVGRFSVKSRQAKLLMILADRPCTDQEATIAVLGLEVTPSQFDGCRRRMSDLRAVNYLYDTGRRRKNSGSGDESIVWGITDAGRRAVANLNVTGWSR